MKKILCIITFIILTTLGCKKDNESGSVTVYNNTKDVYSIEFNGQYEGLLNGFSNKTYYLEPGNYTFKAVQESGYLFYQDVYYSNFTLKPGEQLTIRFP